MQTPVTHAELVQADADPHCPLGPQVWTPLPEHCVDPGTHTPVQAPLAHAYVQADALVHWPVALQVCTPLPEHCVVPGVQTPVHEPETQAAFTQAVALPH